LSASLLGFYTAYSGVPVLWEFIKNKMKKDLDID